MKQAERKVKLSTFEPDLGNANVGNEDHESRTYGKLLNQWLSVFSCYEGILLWENPWRIHSDTK